MNILDPFGIGYGKMIGSFLHPERGYKEAEKQIREAQARQRAGLSPYSQTGLEQRGPLGEAERSLLDPGALYEKWAAGYQESPAAAQMRERAKQAGLEAASSMGLMGSSAALQNIEQSAADISARDRQSYLEDLMRKYLAGIGIGQQLYGTGADIASRLAEMEGRMGENLAGARYGRETAPGGLFGKFLGSGIGAAAGGAIGGPVGAVQGASMGSKWFS